jgi:hypothetical protein
MRGLRLLMAVGLCVAILALSPSSPVSPPEAQAFQKGVKGKGKGKGEGHPIIRKSLRHLRQTKNLLAKGAHDFGGHRVKAIGHIDQAIRELEAALNFDKK